MVESKEDEGAETNGATTEPKEDSGSETKNANGHLPYGTERALFLRLWGWLAIVGSIVVVITTAAWYLISLAIIPQASMRAEEAAQEQLGTLTTQINGLEKRLSELTAKGQGAFEDIRELQGRADEAARNAADRAEDAQEQLTRLRDRISRANDVLAAIRDVESIAKDVAASPGLKDAVVNEITSELSGMITAFEDECPGGWTLERRAIGRFIIGAGNDPDPNFNTWNREGDGQEISLSRYSVLQEGGEEKHLLTIDEMPGHNHDRPAAVVEGRNGVGGDGGSWRTGFGDRLTGSRGNNGEHNNMPPYIALYWCKKD